MKVERLIVNLTAVEPPSGEEGAAFHVIFDIFWYIWATCVAGEPFVT